MYYLKYMSVVLLFLFSPIQGDNSHFDDSFFWPLNYKKQFSSGFGDTRPGRFHMGVDLRTGGQEGLQVFAPENGHVYRIKTSYRGYGKGLYLKGNSGRIYVFGHLQKYNWDIGTYLQKIQIATKRYYQDIYPEKNELPIKKGQLIARSGQTGAGAPHLHFEIRDEQDRPLNPLYFKTNINDKKPPEFESLWLTYLDSTSLFENGLREIKLIPIKLRKNSNYIIRDTIVVHGHFAIKAAISDAVTNGSFLMGPSHVSLAIDGKLFYEVNYRNISYGENKYSILDKDFDPNKKEDHKRVFNLYKKTGNEFSGLNLGASGDGSFQEQSPGYHNVKIEAIDPFGNRRSLSFVFFYLPDCAILASFNRAVVSDSSIELPFSRKFAEAVFDSIVVTHTGVDSLIVRVFPQIEMRDGKIILKGNFSLWPYYKIRFIKDGIKYPAYSISTQNIIPNGKPAVDSARTEIIDDGVLLTAFSSTSGINWLMAEIVTDIGGERRFYQKFDTNSFSLFFKPGYDVKKIISIIIRGPVGFLPDTLNNPIYIAQADSSIGIQLKPGMSLNFESGDLFDNALFQIKDTIIQEPETGYFARQPFILLPGILSFADWADLQNRFDDEIETEKIGLYVLHKEKGWLWAGGQYNSTSGLLHSDLGGAGVVAVIVDTAAPVIKSLNIDEGGRVKISRPEIKFIVDDELSKIENDLSFVVTIDGKWLSPEYDPERKTFRSKPYWRLVPGKHVLRIEATDRCGNKTVVNRNFRVKAGVGN